MLKLIFSNTEYDAELIEKISLLSTEINTVLNGTLGEITETHIKAFMDQLDIIIDTPEGETPDFVSIKSELRKDTNIEVNDLYNADQTFIYETDKFKTYADEASYDVTDQEITDEAQRIKLITYYTFNALPIQSDWEILIYYRIYAN